MALKYKRVLLKLSGEALAGDKKTGIDPAILSEVSEKIRQVYEMGVEISIVVGGGNFWRAEAASAWTGQLLIIWGCWRQS